MRSRQIEISFVAVRAAERRGGGAHRPRVAVRRRRPVAGQGTRSCDKAVERLALGDPLDQVRPEQLVADGGPDLSTPRWRWSSWASTARTCARASPRYMRSVGRTSRRIARSKFSVERYRFLHRVRRLWHIGAGATRTPGQGHKDIHGSIVEFARDSTWNGRFAADLHRRCCAGLGRRRTHRRSDGHERQSRWACARSR